MSTKKGMGQKLRKFMDVLRCIKLFRSMEIGELNQLYFCLKETCEVTDDCSDGLICRNQKCKPCFQSGQCPFGHYCKDGSCKKEEIEDTCDTSLVRLHYSQYFWKWTKTNPMKFIRKSNSLWRNQTWFCVCLYKWNLISW